MNKMSLKMMVQDNDVINGLVSIIIPAYQAEKFIKRSVESALEQTYDKIEVIVVENGCTDGTLKVVEKIHDNRLIVLHSDKGVSKARNKGMDNCKGEFLFFLDADDWLESDAIENMLTVIEDDTDLVSARYFGDKPFEKYYSKKYEAGSEEYIVKCLCTPTKRGNCTGNLYRTTFIRNNMISFDTNIDHAEDSFFFISVLVHAPVVIDLEKPVYHVFNNLESVTRKPGNISYSDFEDAIIKISDLLNDRSERIKNAVYIFTLNQLLVILVHNVGRTGFFNELKRIKTTSEQRVFQRAIQNAKYRDLDLKRVIVFILIKIKLYFLVYLALKIRDNSNIRK